LFLHKHTNQFYPIDWSLKLFLKKWILCSLNFQLHPW
jgi:hypothetical protein